jgi:CRP-like cAMP-binding protein
MNPSGQASLGPWLSSGISATKNHLLAALPADELSAMTADLELVPMLPGDVVGSSGQALSHAYFPATAVVSLHYVSDAGMLTEIADVGHEGMVGTALVLGGGSATSSALVKIGGHGYRLAREPLANWFTRSEMLRSLLLRYMQALIVQVGQTAVCYRHHTIDQQLSRWLLSTSDRMPSSELVMTQELVAGLLGVRRESISQAAAKLSAGGYIRYRRGHISILDRVGLQTLACECYAVVKAETQRLLPRTPAADSSKHLYKANI